MEAERTKLQPNEAMNQLLKSFQHLDMSKTLDNEKVLTPNHTNFNFKEASPFLIHINQRPRRKKLDLGESNTKEKNTKPNSSGEMASTIGGKTEMAEKLGSKETTEIIEISDSEDDGKKDGLVKNLFDLTKENIEKHLTMVAKKMPKESLINSWRNKVNESRSRKSILPVNEMEFEAFISENTDEIESQSIESSQQSVETIVQVKPKNLRQGSEAEESFMTALDENGGTFLEEKTLTATNHGKVDPKEKTEIILQTQEVYEHFDPESNIVFYENKLLANPKNSITVKSTDNDVIVLNTSSESGTCTDFAVPTDYDTDDLRKELKHFGEVPGPITKGTKRLYLKRLIRYKRRPQKAIKNLKNPTKCSK